MPRHYQSSVSPVAPASTKLPTSVAGLAEAGAPAVGGHFAQPDGFCAPAKVIPAIIAAVTMAMWTPTIAAPTVISQYQQGPSFTAPEKVLPTLAAVISPGWSEATLPGKTFRFSWPEGFASPPKLFPPAAITLNHWTPTLGVNALPQPFDRGSYAAPDKFGLAAPAVVLLPSWLGEVGPPAKQFVFWGGEIFTSPAKVLPPAAATLNAWLPNVAATSVSTPHLFPAALAAPEKVLVPAATPNIAWLGQMPTVTQTPRFAAAENFAPLKVMPLAAIGPTICAQAAQVRLAMEALGAELAPAMEAQAAQIRLAMEAMAARVVCC
ncbi:MAG TPA: hypothetical protein VGR34_06135 [Candidatus Dormibacteraeota bacterium]|nr:hypothetical protein [Candidatus Dormibacteraeota bacterium]